MVWIGHANAFISAIQINLYSGVDLVHKIGKGWAQALMAKGVCYKKKWQVEYSMQCNPDEKPQPDGLMQFRLKQTGKKSDA